MQKKLTEMSHNKGLIDTLYKNTRTVKAVSEKIPHFVERLEQKRKVHDMAAHILVGMDKLEKQQQNILQAIGKDNKEVIQSL